MKICKYQVIANMLFGFMVDWMSTVAPFRHKNRRVATQLKSLSPILVLINRVIAVFSTDQKKNAASVKEMLHSRECSINSTKIC